MALEFHSQKAQTPNYHHHFLKDFRGHSAQMLLLHLIFDKSHQPHSLSVATLQDSLNRKHLHKIVPTRSHSF